MRPDNGTPPCSTGSPHTPDTKKQPSYLPTGATNHAFYQDKYEFQCPAQRGHHGIKDSGPFLASTLQRALSEA